MLLALLLYMNTFQSIVYGAGESEDSGLSKEMEYLEHSNGTGGYLYKELKGVTLATTSTKYKTIGWKFKLFTANGEYITMMKVVEGSNFFEVGGQYNGKQDYKMQFDFIPDNESSINACQQNTSSCNWNRSIMDNFMIEYANNATARSNIIAVLQQGGTILADAIMTTVVNGDEKGSIKSGAKWSDSNKFSGTVYTTQAGILGAASWAQSARNDISTKYYNLYRKFKPQPIPVKGELITRYFEVDGNNKVVAALGAPNSQIVEIEGNGTTVTAPYKDFGDLKYKGYSAPSTDNVSIGTTNSTFKPGKDISVTLTKSQKKIYVNYFYQQDITKPYLDSTLIVNPTTIEFQGEDMKVNVTVQNEIKNLSDPNKIKSKEIITFKDNESNLVKKWNATDKTLSFSQTFEFMVPKGVMDNVKEYVQKFTSKSEVTLTDGTLIAVRNGETLITGKAQPPAPPPKPKAQITIEGLTVEDSRPQTPAGWWGANTVQMIAGQGYMVYGAGIPGPGQTIEDFQWALDQVDYSKETLSSEWEGRVFYPVSTIGTTQEITLVVYDNLGQAGLAKMYVEVIAPPPKADFVANPNPGNAGETINLINQSKDYYGDPMEPTWTIVNPLGESSNATTWDATIENAIEGDYTVTLMVENEKGLDSITKTIKVYGPPSVQITTPISTNPNLPDLLSSDVGIQWRYIENETARRSQKKFEVIIKSASSGGVVKQSGIIDSSATTWTPTGLEPNKTYSAEVRVSDGYLWSDWSEKRYFVYNNQPIAQFDAPTILYAGETIELINNSYDNDLDPSQYKQDLSIVWTVEYPNGDMTTFTGAENWNLTIPNAERGTYKVSLQVIDAYGSWSATYPKTIRVYGYPIATITDPISEDPTKPTVYTTNSPTIKWDYVHPDSLYQRKFEVEIYKQDGTLEVTSGEINSANEYWEAVGLSGGQVYKVQVRVNDGNRWSTWAVPKYFKVNSAPVADFVTDKESYFEGQTITIINKSYDPDGEPLHMTWTIIDPKLVTKTIETDKMDDITIPNALEGQYNVHLKVEDPYHLSNTKQQDVFVNSNKVKAKLNVTGTLKVNRKIILDSSKSTSPAAYPVLPSKTKFTITPVTAGISTSDIKPASSVAGKETQEILVKKAGFYKVTLYVENGLGSSDTTEETVYIEPDNAPIADFTVTQNIYRDTLNGDKYWAEIKLIDQSRSSDDVIKERIWTIKYNANNDKDLNAYPIFTDDTPLILKESDLIDGQEYEFSIGTLPAKAMKTGNNLTIKVPDVGRYLMELEVIEDFAQPTILDYISESDYLKDSTKDKPLEEKIITVWNKKPHVEFK